MNQLIKENRQLWANIRNFLFTATKLEALAERDVSVVRRDKIRAALIEHYIETEFEG